MWTVETEMAITRANMDKVLEDYAVSKVWQLNGWYLLFESTVDNLGEKLPTMGKRKIANGWSISKRARAAISRPAGETAAVGK